jgi:hypothetical protein
MLALVTIEFISYSLLTFKILHHIINVAFSILCCNSIPCIAERCLFLLSLLLAQLAQALIAATTTTTAATTTTTVATTTTAPAG